MCGHYKQVVSGQARVSSFRYTICKLLPALPAPPAPSLTLRVVARSTAREGKGRPGDSELGPGRARLPAVSAPASQHANKELRYSDVPELRCVRVQGHACADTC